MGDFKQFDDRVSNMEAPVTSGFFLDASGNPWEKRPDRVIDKYMSKVTVSRDQHWQYKKYLDQRQWFELEMYFDKLLNTADTDDQIRIKKAKEVVSKILQENNNG